MKGTPFIPVTLVRDSSLAWLNALTITGVYRKTRPPITGAVHISGTTYVAILGEAEHIAVMETQDEIMQRIEDSFNG